MGSTDQAKKTDSAVAHCPMCERPAAPRSEKYFPFCSLRCQMDDLGHWLDEDYRVPDDRSGGD